MNRAGTDSIAVGAILGGAAFGIAGTLALTGAVANFPGTGSVTTVTLNCVTVAEAPRLSVPASGGIVLSGQTLWFREDAAGRRRGCPRYRVSRESMEARQLESVAWQRQSMEQQRQSMAQVLEHLGQAQEARDQAGRKAAVEALREELKRRPGR